MKIIAETSQAIWRIARDKKSRELAFKAKVQSTPRLHAGVIL